MIMSVFRLIRGDTFSPAFDNRKLDVFSGAATGAAAGSAAGPYGAALGAGIGAVGAIASGIIVSNSSLRNQRAMFHEMNAYNDPSKQADRLLKAGYNPYVMSGAINTGNQAVPGDGNAPAQMMQNGALAAAHSECRSARKGN